MNEVYLDYLVKFCFIGSVVLLGISIYLFFHDKIKDNIHFLFKRKKKEISVPPIKHPIPIEDDKTVVFGLDNTVEVTSYEKDN